MHGIVSVLDDIHSEKTRKVWELLERELGLNKIKETPIPHFSWQIAENYAFENIAPPLETLARRTSPFIVRTNGLGVFSGPDPVLYIPVVKEPRLAMLHELVWENLGQAATGLSPFYAPKAWVPHITLANKDLTAEKLAAAVELLSKEYFNWEINIDNFAVIFQNDGEIGQERIRYSLAD